MTPPLSPPAPHPSSTPPPRTDASLAVQVRASPLETFVALMGAPKHSMNAVMNGTFPVQSLDDHSDVVRMCLRPAWLKVAWASPRDFCLARYVLGFACCVGRVFVYHNAKCLCVRVCLSMITPSLLLRILQPQQQIQNKGKDRYKIVSYPSLHSTIVATVWRCNPILHVELSYTMHYCLLYHTTAV